MFNVGTGELLVILLVALLVLGPEKLPDAARKIGNVMSEMRRMSQGFQNEIRNAIDEAAPDVSTEVSTTPPRLEPVSEAEGRTETDFATSKGDPDVGREARTDPPAASTDDSAA